MTELAMATPPKTSYLTAEEILAVDDMGYMDLEVPEWGGTVRLKSLTGNQRDQYENSIVSQRGKTTQVNLQGIRARLCSLCIVDETGKRLFTDAQVQRLGQKSAKGLDRVFEVCQSMNGLTDTDVAELEGNSDGAQSDGSTST